LSGHGAGRCYYAGRWSIERGSRLAAAGSEHLTMKTW
jgi:hypothetical protein